MSDIVKNLTNSLSLNQPNSSTLKRRLSALKMLTKAKDTTKSLVQEVLEKRHSLDSKHPVSSTKDQVSSSSNNSSSQTLPSPVNKNQQHAKYQKHQSLPIKKVFTFKKKNQSLEFLSSSPSTSSSSLIHTTSSTEPSSPIAFATTTTTGPEHSIVIHNTIADGDKTNLIFSDVNRPGGFATACDFRSANEKKNGEFHSLFKSVPEKDLLIEDYKCALQKDILLQGHLFVSEHHICFKSNIFGFITNLVIDFSELVRVEKKSIAKIIPNGILIATNTSTYVFASFFSRDSAYDQIMKIWDLNKKVSSVTPFKSNVLEAEEMTDDDDDNSSISSTQSLTNMNIPSSSITYKDPTIQQSIPNTAKLFPPINNNDSKDQLVVNTSHNLETTKSTALATESVMDNTEKQHSRPRAVSDSYAKIKEKRNDNSLSTTYPFIHNSTSLKRDYDQEHSTGIKRTKACPCSIHNKHYFHVALNETYSGTVDAMFRLLFDSDFFKNFLERYENFESNNDNDDNNKKKIMNVILTFICVF
ncbi:GRAM domain-containing protein [Cokeromyces recurvatus]|uniref:GRAM domain-containing protein n=1 Tax=Cokeromyces recurvatus TaxID=90255 RepID=UPI00221EFABA|nr:GRAM domain-containing protein [Cokeromyces recurvatus]KAI7902009.1 GRAM domain-containing protein [Cokeromyces recurvatus]